MFVSPTCTAVLLTPLVPGSAPFPVPHSNPTALRSCSRPPGPSSGSPELAASTPRDQAPNRAVAHAAPCSSVHVWPSSLSKSVGPHDAPHLLTDGGCSAAPKSAASGPLAADVGADASGPRLSPWPPSHFFGPSVFLTGWPEISHTGQRQGSAVFLPSGLQNDGPHTRLRSKLFKMLLLSPEILTRPRVGWHRGRRPAVRADGEGSHPGLGPSPLLPFWFQMKVLERVGTKHLWAHGLPSIPGPPRG